LRITSFAYLAPVAILTSPLAQTYSRIFEDSTDINIGAPQPVIDLAEFTDDDVPVGLDAVLLEFSPVRKQAVFMPVFLRFFLSCVPRFFIMPRIYVLYFIRSSAVGRSAARRSG